MLLKEYWFRELYLGLKVTASFDRSESYTRVIDGQVRCSTSITGRAWLARTRYMEVQTCAGLPQVPMLWTIIEPNGNGLLEDSHMPVGWPLHINGAVRQCCIHRSATLQELDDMRKNIT